MFLQSPPAKITKLQEQQTPQPSHVWASLKEARRAALQHERPLVAFFSEDKGKYESALAFFMSLEGTKLRSSFEIWLPKPEQSDLPNVIEALGFSKPPILALLSINGKSAKKMALGDACYPLSTAFEKMFQGPSVESMIQAFFGRGSQESLVQNFLVAWKQDLQAAAQEPHRSWLLTLLNDKDEDLRFWAATRLVEANAPIKANEPRPFLILATFMEKSFNAMVRHGNRNDKYIVENVSAGWGFKEKIFFWPGSFHEKAPFWKAIRSSLKNDPNMRINVPIYSILAPHLKSEDKDWIVKQLENEAKGGTAPDFRMAVLYWIASDWLLVYGQPNDWEAFQHLVVPMKWDGALQQLKSEIDTFNEYWNSKPQLQGMFCEGETSESFWKNPDACLESWGVTRENLVELGMEKIKWKNRPRVPKYPYNASKSGFSVTLRLQLIVGTDGRPKWIRPEPGYALAYFAPTGLAYAQKLVFEPSMVAGVARPSQFILIMPFKR